MAGFVHGVLVLLLIALCSLTTALEARPSPNDTTDTTIEEAAIGAQSTSNRTVVACPGVPAGPGTGYVNWQCSDGTPEGGQCTGGCVAGAEAPYGPPLAVCSSGRYIISSTCMSGVNYGFDDVQDGGLPLPSSSLGLVWKGLRVANSVSFGACDGRNGYKTGVVTYPNVAYSLEVGANDLTNLVRIEAPTKAAKISVYKFFATAAWQDNLIMDLSAYDASGNKLALKRYELFVDARKEIDLSADLRFSGIHRLTIVTSGGNAVTCKTGKQVVIDNMQIYIQ